MIAAAQQVSVVRLLARLQRSKAGFRPVKARLIGCRLASFEAAKQALSLEYLLLQNGDCFLQGPLSGRGVKSYASQGQAQDEREKVGSNKPKDFLLTASSYQYILQHSAESETLKGLRKDTAESWPTAKQMQVAPDQGRFLTWLVQLLNVSQALEVGVFTGYSAVCIAQGLKDGGRLIACESDERPLNLARQAFEGAGVADKVELVVGRAANTLQNLIDGSGRKHFDFAFVDADKRGYPLYHEQLLSLIRPGGLIVYDNMLWYGAVADPQDQRKSTSALRKFCSQLMDDGRVDACLVPVGDGMALCRRL